MRSGVPITYPLWECHCRAGSSHIPLITNGSSQFVFLIQTHLLYIRLLHILWFKSVGSIIFIVNGEKVQLLLINLYLQGVF